MARVLLRVARERGSLVLEADGRHLMTDVWTSLGVIVAIIVVGLTDQSWIDPAIALLVAVNIAWTGFDLLRKSFDGLMDRALPEEPVVLHERLHVLVSDGESRGAPVEHTPGVWREPDGTLHTDDPVRALAALRFVR